MIPVAKPCLKKNELKYITHCVNSEWISSAGKYVKDFEEEFSKKCTTSYALSCSNGTVALHLALLAINLKKGDEVIIPNLTFAATANAIRYCHAKEILVDVDKETFNILPEEIEKNITKQTKAIIVVHLYGFPCDMNKILKIAKKHNLYVIEDAAEAHLATYEHKPVGSIGDIGSFSFFGNKLITTGEGGMCITNNKELLNTMDVLKNHGMKTKGVYIHDIIGYNYRLTNMQAAIGLAQLEQIDEFIKRRDEIARLYIKELQEIEYISFQKPYENSKQVYWMFSIILNKNAPISIDELALKLKEKGIDSRRMFYPLSEMKPYKTHKKFPNSTFLYKHSLVLPTFYELTNKQILYICDEIKNILNKD